MKVSLPSRLLPFLSRPKPLLARTLTVVFSLCAYAYGGSITVTDENFLSSRYNQSGRGTLSEGDVVTVSTTDASPDFRWCLTNRYFSNNTGRENGTLSLLEGASLSIDADYSYGYSQVGNVHLGTNSTLTLKSAFAATGPLEAFQMESGSKVVLTPSSREGAEVANATLYLGDKEENDDSSFIMLRAALGGTATITNTGTEAVYLLNAQDESLSMENIYVEAHGKYNIEIHARVENATLLNSTRGKNLSLDHADNSVSGINAVSGDVILTNQAEEVKMETLHIGSVDETYGDGRKVTVKDASGDSSLVSFKTFGETAQWGGDIVPSGLYAYEGAQLDADLELVATRDTSIKFQVNESTGLDLCGNTLTLGEGLDLQNYSRHTDAALGDSILLFTNVDVLTLQVGGGARSQVFDNKYFTYETGFVAASDYFSSTFKDKYGLEAYSIPELERVEEGDGYYLRGWFLEYNQMADNAALGNVSLVYQQIYIPEPVTATLSLLALVALASRRRSR